MLVFELCTGKTNILHAVGGTLFNLIEQRSKMGITDGLDEIEILEIIGEVSNGLLHMHMNEPPIAHRDLKVSIYLS